MFRPVIKRLALILLLLLAMLSVVPLCGAAEEGIGVLVVAHGSDEASWNEVVQQAVAEVNLPYPVELGFLEFAEPDIHAAVAALEARGVDKIITVPLFVSSYSNHIEEIKYVLGLRPDLPEAEEASGGHPGGGGDGAEEEELTPVDTEAEIVLTPALDDHVMVAGILADRLQTISENPGEEIAVLVGHGSDTGEGQGKWRETFQSLAARLKDLLNLKDADYGFALMGEPTVRDSVYEAVYRGDVLVVPVMLSEGYFTDTVIPDMLLNGLDYRYPDAGNRALLPHSNIAGFIELRVNDVVLPPLEIKKEGNLCRVNYTDVALEDDGKICVCGSFAFRAMQAALAELWPGEIPEQDWIYVKGPYSDGVEAALETIVGAGNFSLEQREQNTGFYNFKVTDQRSGKAVNITVKPEVYPENFFELKKKVQAGTATAEEKQEFQGKRARLADKVRWDGADQLFTLETIVPSGSGSRSGGGGGASSVTGTSKDIKASAGGSVTYGGATVKIPAGALPGDAKIRVNKLSSSYVDAVVSEGLQVKLGSDIYEITTSGRRDFGDNTITIRIAYDPAKIAAGEQPVICYHDESTGRWVNLPTTVEQGTDGKWYAVTNVNHLTKFAVFSAEDKQVEENRVEEEEQKVITLTIGQTAATVDGRPYTLDAPPCVDSKAGRTLVPVRFVGEALGARADWNPETQQVTIKDSEREIVLTPGSVKVLVDGRATSIDGAPEILSSGRTFVPLRFVSETLGANVDYDTATGQITITRH